MADAQKKPKMLAADLGKHLVRSPRLSEKAVGLNGLGQYVFTVAPKATKLQIKAALERIYGIQITRVNTIHVRGKTRRYGRSTGRTSDYKKAVVLLSKDSKKPEAIEAL